MRVAPRALVGIAVGALAGACGTPGGTGPAGASGAAVDGGSAGGRGAAPTRVEVTATVTYLPVEGGFWALRGDDGTVYDPLNLPASAQVEGLRVHAVLDVRRDLAGTHQVGPVVEVVRLDALGPGGTSAGAG